MKVTYTEEVDILISAKLLGRLRRVRALWRRGYQRLYVVGEQ